MQTENIPVQFKKTNMNNVLNGVNINNSVVGKRYDFVSGAGINLLSFASGKLRSTVTFSDDRLFIEVIPKRFNTVPAILYEDIIGVTVDFRISFAYWFFIIFSALCAIANPLFLILIPILIFLGLSRKITITQRNGIRAVIYSRSKEDTCAFNDDIRKVAKIL